VRDPTPEKHPPTECDLVLDDLMLRVRRAREALRGLLDDRRGGRTPMITEARLESKIALESFVAALDERSLPIPRQIHDELQLVSRLVARR
jgi:hypothetical protein